MLDSALNLGPLLLTWLAVPLVAVLGAIRARLAAPIGIVLSALAFGAVAWSWATDVGRVDVPWAPTWGFQLSFHLDGLAALYTLLATGIGFAVLIYSARYLPPYLKHEDRPPEEGVRFYAFLMLFMASMVGLVMAQDLLLIFVFWDLTAIASYFLIGYDRTEREAQRAALMALLVTGISSILFLVGAMLLFSRYDTFSLPTLVARTEPSPLLTTAVALMAVSALAKSAQVPLHFWLPRAMVAPTPVSAYLHSAAMVAAGVFLLERIYPLLQKSEHLLVLLLAIGLLSMATGGVLALTRDVLKQVLAYSTIAQYGYVVFLLGLGGAAGVAGAAFYVLAHALVKSSLFLTAGAVTEATGEDRLSQLGGLGRTLPLLAAGSGASAAALAGLPLTIGFFKDEVFFQAALHHGWPFAVLALTGTVLTFAYVWRFWSGIFLGPQRQNVNRVSLALVMPVVLLGLLAVVAGIVVEPFTRLAETAGQVSLDAPVRVDLAYHLDSLRPETVLAIATYVLGVLVVMTRRIWLRAARAAAEVGERRGPARWYAGGLKWLNRFSYQIHDIEGQDLRVRLVSVLIPAAILVGVAFIVTPTRASYRVGSVGPDDLPLLLALSLLAGAAVLTTMLKNHLAVVLAVSSVGFTLATAWAFFGGPDVALVAVLVETIMTLLFLGVLALFSQRVLRREEMLPDPAARRDILVGLVAGSGAFVVVWGALSRPSPERSMAVQMILRTPEAHAQDVVSTILADFRGFDTLGEITVIAIALLGSAMLLREGVFR